MVLPITVWGFWEWLAGYMALNATMGLTLFLVFQLAHVVENTEFEHVPLDMTKHIETAWAEHQVKTTSNFAMNNPGDLLVRWRTEFPDRASSFSAGEPYPLSGHQQDRDAEMQEFNLPYNKYDDVRSARFALPGDERPGKKTGGRFLKK